MRDHEVFPTMITPYNADGTVDYGAVEALTEWYAEQGCTGIFAVCQSSESAFLTLDERTRIARRVVEMASGLRKKGKKLTIVASGHVSDSDKEQKEELCAMAQTGIDALILVSNRIDAENTSEENWIEGLYRMLEWLPSGLDLGVYECPKPYKRLMTEKMLQACLSTGRFRFMKDTCCDADLIRKRLKLLRGSDFALYNANAQTLLQTLLDGAAGYCGVMANFHPDLYAWMCEHFEDKEETANLLQSFFTVSAFTESLCYPVTAKYHLSELKGIQMRWDSRSADASLLSAYQKNCIKDMERLAAYFRERLKQA